MCGGFLSSRSDLFVSQIPTANNAATLNNNATLVVPTAYDETPLLYLVVMGFIGS